MILLLDNGSRFTPRIEAHLERLGAGFDIAEPPQADVPGLDRYSGIILSGRRRNDTAMNAVNSGVIRHAVKHGVPLLGICYGAEMLALCLGGTIRRMDRQIRGAERVHITEENPLCSGTIDVFESHSYEVATLPPTLRAVGGSASCRNEIVRYYDSMIFGVQFHPEMSPDGLSLIRRFLGV